MNHETSVAASLASEHEVRIEEPAPGRLDTRPKADAFSVEDLLGQVSRGKVRIPPFQRGLKWEWQDCHRFFDSVFRGFPVGTLLLWQKPAEAAELEFGSVRIDAQALSDALWVVDGQQRITSLVRVLLPRQPDRDKFALYFDLEGQEFVRPARTQAQRQRPLIPLTVVLDSEELLDWLFGNDLPPELRGRAIALGKRIREYQIPAYLVETEDEDLLRKIFDRINSTGKALGTEDVFDALHGSRPGKEPSSFTDIAKRLERLGFGRLENKLLHRVLLAVTGRDVGETGRAQVEETAQAYLDTYRAAQAAVNFLKRDAGIPHVSLLPYKLPIITLGRFFHLHPEPRRRSRDLLARWVWRGAWTGSHQGSTVVTRTALSSIGKDEEAAVQALLRLAGDEAPSNPADGPFNFGRASGKLQALGLLDLAPRHLQTGEPLPINDLATGPEAFRTIFSGGSEGGRNGLRQTVANRIFHPVVGVAPASLLQEAGRESLFQDPESRADGGLPESGPPGAILAERLLTSHGVGHEAWQALVEGDEERFLRLRMETLYEQIGAFLDRKARWGESDRPSIAALVVTDEED